MEHMNIAVLSYTQWFYHLTGAIRQSDFSTQRQTREGVTSILRAYHPSKTLNGVTMEVVLALRLNHVRACWLQTFKYSVIIMSV